ncbi:putative transmembrane protein [Toxoplasma gondii GAB2-2007-GAL-DOM2]|uniref:Transmembrane protein n=4 Tax=Toxoplasma gondii TaxID=5811 RepID=S7V017_TOXGG|nr:hypothetical protein TGGT1_251830 [Toxoplasma gondii GT1]KFG34728.1 putative transmembrane protein [Toxoplasma gondii GAB2-2007-GAL-DOM2]KFG46383.1 putative transmembrane protein [Toxoplasma gondii FOU]RQX70448.1 putative transmembrane protein [Toxoplasma gondii CAST]
MLRRRRILQRLVFLYLGGLLYFRIIQCCAQYLFDDSAEYYPTVKPFEAGKFQNFIPYVSSPLFGSAKKGDQLDFPTSFLYSGVLSPESHKFVEAFQTRWNRTENRANLSTKQSSVNPNGELAFQHWLPEDFVRSTVPSSPSEDAGEKEPKPESASSETEEATTAGVRFIQNERLFFSLEDRPPDLQSMSSSGTAARTWGKIKTQMLHDHYDMPGDHGYEPFVHTRTNATVTRSSQWDGYFPVVDHISKTNDLLRLATPDAIAIQDVADYVLEELRQRGNSTTFYDAVSTLPPDIIVAMGMDSSDAYSVVRCLKGYQAVSTSVCASPLGEEIPIQGSCVGAGAYDTEMSRCFTVSEVSLSKES